MIEVDENLQALLQNVVRLAIAHVGDEADAAGIVLLGGVVEALGARQEGIGHDGSPGKSGKRSGEFGGRFATVRAILSEVAGGLNRSVHLSAP